MRDNQVGCPLRLPRLIITRLNVYINTAYQPLPSEQSMIEGWEREKTKRKKKGTHNYTQASK